MPGGPIFNNAATPFPYGHTQHFMPTGHDRIGGALPVEVEVDVSPAGLPKTVLVGLPEAAVKESTHRVERALVNSGFQRL